jgi:hypothetical protein
MGCLLATEYALTRSGANPAASLGELLALSLLTMVAGAQVLHPFRWRLKLLPAIPRVGERVGGATGQRAHAPINARPTPERRQPGTGVAVHEEEDWNGQFALIVPQVGGRA